MKRLLKAVLIPMTLVMILVMALLFFGASSVRAFSAEPMIVNQIIIENQSVSVIKVECPDRDSSNLKNYKNTGTFVAALPEPTFHVGKIQPLMV